MNENVIEVFKTEAAELLFELESALLGVEEAPDDKTVIERVFRSLHTIKGSGAMVGLNEIASFAHKLEDMFEMVRQERIQISKKLVDLTLSSVDLIRLMLDAPDSPELQEKAEEIILELTGLDSSTDSSESGAWPEAESETNSSQEEAEAEVANGEALPDKLNGGGTYRISFRPNIDIFSRGANPALLLNELRGLGECDVTACIDDLPDLHELDPEQCYTSWEIILTSSADINSIRDVFIFVEDECELKIDVIAEHGPEDDAPRKLGEVLVERGDISPEQVAKVLSKQKRIGVMLIEEGLVSPGKVQAALMEQQHEKHMREKQEERAAASVRVPAAKLDSLVDLVGELVIVQASLGQLAASRRLPELRSIAEHVDRLTAELRDNAMSLRMLPIGVIFSKFNRLIRDLSKDLGKEVVLVTDGAEVELDKTVIERLHDPLVHMIRNSIDHGIEMPEARVASGKNRQGALHLSAEHSGAHVLIKIADDGAGLDKDEIRTKAIEKGLIPQNSEQSEKEIFSLIFAPGFSTAQKVTSVSGRGVGMDVVKRSIDSLGGSIEISSEKGSGTTITLKLPLTLAIIDGLLVKIGDAYYVLPLSFVEECVELTGKNAGKEHGGKLVFLRKNIVPYIRLRDRFSISGEAPTAEQVVIVETVEGKIGFVVDKVIGQLQTVIKNLGKMYRDVNGISGATILGDGTIALIIDVPRLVKASVSEEINQAV
jgi:two-component system chemotaxis sensor kinase CheA